jgi:type IV secretory pathway TrbF-like protein
MHDFGGVEPKKSVFDKNFWKIQGVGSIAFSYARAMTLVAVVGWGAAGWVYSDFRELAANGSTQVYVGERDANGVIRPMFGGDRPYSPDQATIDSFLRQWITNARWVSKDKVLMGRNVNQALAVMDDIPKAMLNQHYGLKPPVTLADSGLARSIDPLGANLVSGNTYRLDWIEYEINGTQALPPMRRTGNFTIVHRNPTSQEEFNRNPSGLWVVEFDSEVFRIPAGLISP